ARILGYRRARGATEPLLARAEETDAVVAKAAFDALAAVASLDELPKVIPVATSRTEGEVRDRAEKALYAICLKQNDVSRRSEPLANALPGTPTPTARASLLQVMAMLADPAGARALGEACGDPVPETRDTALRLLVNWPDSTPVPTLLRVFKTTTNDVHRILALKGIVTLASLRPGDPTASASTSAPKPPSAEAVAWLTEARAALRPNAEERKILVSGLGDLNAAPGLRLLEPYLADPEVHHDAELAALRAIRNLTTDADRAAARPLLEKIMASTLDPDVRKQAQDALRGSSPKP
ncbi:MAG: hypothetical protein JNL97_14320, partial [Verrucomicrobiales bacterium]|nr:hypothetical protein [Verrucomicrobiales bacterium]